MELDAKIIYEVALKKALEKEQQLIELMALYQQSLAKIKELEDKINELNNCQ